MVAARHLTYGQSQTNPRSASETSFLDPVRTGRSCGSHCLADVYQQLGRGVSEGLSERHQQNQAGGRNRARRLYTTRQLERSEGKGNRDDQGGCWQAVAGFVCGAKKG